MECQLHCEHLDGLNPGQASHDFERPGRVGYGLQQQLQNELHNSFKKREVQFVIVQVPVFVQMCALDLEAGQRAGLTILEELTRGRPSPCPALAGAPSCGPTDSPGVGQRACREGGARHVVVKRYAKLVPLPHEWRVAAQRRRRGHRWSEGEAVRKLGLKVWREEQHNEKLRRAATTVQEAYREHVRRRSAATRDVESEVVRAVCRHAYLQAALGTVAVGTKPVEGDHGPTEDEILDAAVARADEERRIWQDGLRNVLPAAEVVASRLRICCPCGGAVKARISESTDICCRHCGGQQAGVLLFVCVRRKCRSVTCAACDKGLIAAAVKQELQPGLHVWAERACTSGPG